MLLVHLVLSGRSARPVSILNWGTALLISTWGLLGSFSVEGSDLISNLESTMELQAEVRWKKIVSLSVALSEEKWISHGV